MSPNFYNSSDGWNQEQASELDDDNLSDGFFADFDVGIIFLRPDGTSERKDPNWVVDAGFNYLAPGVFGSKAVWENMKEMDRRKLSEHALIRFSQWNDLEWHTWYTDYQYRLHRRTERVHR